MNCVTALSHHPDAAAAVGEAVGTVLDRIDPHPDLAIVLASGDHAVRMGPVAATVDSLLAPETLVGSTVSDIFGGDAERPSGASVAVVAVSSCPVSPIRVEAAPDGRMAGLPDDTAAGTVALLFGVPGFPVATLLAQLQAAQLMSGPGPVLPSNSLDLPSGPPAIVGSMPAGRTGPVDPLLVLGGEVHRSGAVGVLVSPGAASVCEPVFPDQSVIGPDDGDEFRPNVPPDLFADTDFDIGSIDEPPPSAVMEPPWSTRADGVLLFLDPGHHALQYPLPDLWSVDGRLGPDWLGVVGRTVVHPSGAPAFGPGAAALVVDTVELL